MFRYKRNTHNQYQCAASHSWQRDLARAYPFSRSQELRVFQDFWSNGIPVVVVNSLDYISMHSLDRQYFIKKHGKEQVRLVDCEGKIADVPSTLGAFLSGFGDQRSPSAPILKVKVAMQPIYVI